MGPILEETKEEVDNAAVAEKKSRCMFLLLIAAVVPLIVLPPEMRTKTPTQRQRLLEIIMLASEDTKASYFFVLFCFVSNGYIRSSME
mmetsp:Transcript_19803/g.42970  ORF Transcript_19803/g.42970 Transcript_19803/m.42970 type:complete len:88 (-) Transcript_19803:245-508(-)